MTTPVDIFLATLTELDLKTQAYAVRTLFGKINSACIGLIATALRNERAEEGSGIDGFNDAIAAAMAKQESNDSLNYMGLTTRADPMVTVGILLGLKSAVATGTNLPDDLLAAVDNPRSSLEFMSQPRPLTDKRKKDLEALAEVLKTPVETLVKITEDTAARDARRLREMGPDILERLFETPPSLPDFDALDTPYKARMFRAFDSVLESQAQQAVVAITRGAGMRLGDIPLIQAGQTALRDWAKTATQTDPDLALALAA